MRAEALERYRALALPTTREEHWRFTDLRGFDPDSFTGAGEAADAVTETVVPGIDALATFEVDDVGRIEQTSGSLPDGLLCERLGDDHPLLHSLVGWDEKFAAHNAALWQNGLLVQVSRDVRLEAPLLVRVANRINGGSLFWRLLIVAEPGSSFTVIEDFESADPGLGGYLNAVSEIIVKERAKVEYVSVQNVSRTTWHFASHHARVEQDAELDWVAAGFGSGRGKVRIQNDLVGRGAASRVTGAYFADGVQHLDYDTFQLHAAPDTTSDFAFKGALRDRASAVWRGMIRVEPDAQRTNAYQENRNLLLSKTAHADSIPGLEIMANDVRCTHGATLGQVDREQLFYLMSRGLPRHEAERLIVRGFFQDVLNRIELEPVRDALAHALESRIPGA